MIDVLETSLALETSAHSSPVVTRRVRSSICIDFCFVSLFLITITYYSYDLICFSFFCHCYLLFILFVSYFKLDGSEDDPRGGKETPGEKES